MDWKFGQGVCNLTERVRNDGHGQWKNEINIMQWCGICRSMIRFDFPTAHTNDGFDGNYRDGRWLHCRERRRSYS
jgi:hypothetical protein